jgi:Fic family protein
MQVNDLIRRIDANQSKIQSGRKLSEKERLTSDLYDKIMTTYTSNAIEGNSLSLDETLGVFASRDDLARIRTRDELEALDHFEAHDYMMETAHVSPLTFSEEIIRKLHYLFYREIDCDEAGEYRRVEVYITGTEFVPPSPEEVPTLMSEFVVELNRQKNLHPVLLSAYAHRRLAEIHPFVDGNGRTARLLMNLVLVNAEYRVVSIPPIYRHSYYAALQSSQHLPSAGNDQFNELICLYELESQKDYCRMLKIPLKSAPEPER